MEKMERPTLRDSVGKITSYADEAQTYATFRRQFISDYEKLNSEYQKSNMNYKEYKHKLDKLLSSKTRHDWISYYDSYIYLLYKKIDFSIDSVRQIMLDEDIESIFVEPEEVRIAFLKLTADDQKKLEREAEVRLKKEGVFTPMQRRAYLETIEKSKIGITKKYDLSKFKHLYDVEEPAKPSEMEKGVSKETQDKVVFRKQQIQKGATNIDAENFSTENVFSSENSGISNEESKSIEVKRFWLFAIFSKLFRMLFGDKIDSQSFLSKDVTIGTSLLTQEKISRISKDNYYEKAKVDLNLLTKESIKLRNVLRGKESSKRNIFLIGTLANLSVRNISSWLIKTFPNFFELMYNGIRLANIKMLSNTYVNVMVFSCLISIIAGFILSAGFFLSMGLPLFVVFVRSFVFSLILCILTFSAFYGYPFNRIKERRRNIKTNLSFAISHMAAVSGGDVPPFTMFELLAQSPEYGEVTIEMQRIVDYCNLFGYDMMISIRSVVATTPSPELKEFLSGLVSCIESGGQIKNYLIESSKNSFVSYQLERQKFNEVISTYSDIYTGILIAAPLFFVSALSMVGLLGGQIGGFNVKFLIGAGIYFVIPVLNVGFIIFLEATQPEV